MENNIDFDYRDLLKEPLSDSELTALAVKANLEVWGLINPRSTVFKKLSRSREELTKDEALAIIKEKPRMLFRPILEKGSHLVLGFKEEQFKTIVS